MKRFLSILFAIVCVACVMAGCGGSKKTTYPITVAPTTGGVVTADKTKAAAGETVSLTITPEAGYYLQSLTKNGVDVADVFRMPAEAVTIEAVFCEDVAETIVYDVITDASEGGEIATSLRKAAAGETVLLTVTPHEGYALDYVELDGVAYEGTSFVMPSAPVTVFAYFVKNLNSYNVTAVNGRYGTVSVNRTKCLSGGTVEVDYIPLNGYVLDYFTLNGQNVGASRLITMPAEDAVISAVFCKAIEDTNVRLSAVMSHSTAYSYWYFAYTDQGLDITVKVEDMLLILTGDPIYRDYVECVVALAPTRAEWVVGKTVKLTVTADGTCFMRTAVSGTAFGKEVYDFDRALWSGEADVKSIMKKQGYSGYEAKIHVSYELLGASAAECKGRVAVMPAMNHSESLYGGRWISYNNDAWLNATAYPVVQPDGTLG